MNTRTTFHIWWLSIQNTVRVLIRMSWLDVKSAPCQFLTGARGDSNRKINTSINKNRKE